MVNDLKQAGIHQEAGQFFARIADPATYAGYGQLMADQAAAMLKGSAALQEAMTAAYGTAAFRT
eukprot:5889679-Alexandrium_andersonii.AAC.1